MAKKRGRKVAASRDELATVAAAFIAANRATEISQRDWCAGVCAHHQALGTKAASTGLRRSLVRMTAETYKRRRLTPALKLYRDDKDFAQTVDAWARVLAHEWRKPKV
jgi:hypothetical protein